MKETKEQLAMKLNALLKKCGSGYVRKNAALLKVGEVFEDLGHKFKAIEGGCGNCDIGLHNLECINGCGKLLGLAFKEVQK